MRFTTQSRSFTAIGTVSSGMVEKIWIVEIKQPTFAKRIDKFSYNRICTELYSSLGAVIRKRSH